MGDGGGGPKTARRSHFRSSNIFMAKAAATKGRDAMAMQSKMGKATQATQRKQAVAKMTTGQRSIVATQSATAAAESALVHKEVTKSRGKRRLFGSTSTTVPQLEGKSPVAANVLKRASFLFHALSSHTSAFS